MKTVWRLTLAMIIAMALTACQTKPTVDTDTTSPPETETKPEVVITAAPDPHDFEDPRNLEEGSGSLLAERVIYFDYDKSSVRPEYRAIVSAHATYTASSSSARVTLEGHADERGTREYNLGLGERRGNAVMGLMSAQGARGSQVVVVSYGEERPTCRVSDEDCWSQNRRVEIVYTAQ